MSNQVQAVLPVSVVIPVRLINRFRVEHPEEAWELITLYCFYANKAVIDGTNRPYCLNAYVRSSTKRGKVEGIGWGRDKVIRLKSILMKMGIIAPYVDRDKDGHVKKHYVRLIVEQPFAAKSIPLRFSTGDDIVHPPEHSTGGFQNATAFTEDILTASSDSKDEDKRESTPDPSGNSERAKGSSDLDSNR